MPQGESLKVILGGIQCLEMSGCGGAGVGSGAGAVAGGVRA